MKYRKCLFLLLAFSVLVTLGVFSLVYSPPKANVEAFNKWYKTSLSEREIYYSERGFVDSEFHASIPMSYAEFIDVVTAIGMTETDINARQHSFDRPYSDILIRAENDLAHLGSDRVAQTS